MRFLGDISIGRATLDHLRRRGHDCMGVTARLPPTASDREIVDLAVAESRVLLCFDLDFGAIVSLSKLCRPSIITFRTSLRGATSLNARLDVILPELEEDLQAGALVTVEDHRARVRRLSAPVGPSSNA